MFKKIASNTIAQIASKVWTALISIFLLSILTNYLSLELFWVYSKVYNYLGIFAFLADLWLYAIAVREISASKDSNDCKKIIWNILTLRVILGVAIIFIALSIALFLPGYQDNITLIAIAIISIFTLISLINSSLLSLMQAKMDIEYSFISTIAGKLLTLFLIIAIAFIWFPKEIYQASGISFLYIMAAGLAGIALNTVMNYFKAKQLCPIVFQADWSYIKHIITISLPYWIALFLSVVYFKIDIILLSILEPWSQADRSIGLYSLPMKIVEVLMVLWGFYLNSLLPSMTKMFQDKDIAWLSKLLHLSSKILLSAASIIVTLGILFRYDMIRIISDESIYLAEQLSYNSADALLVVLCVVVFYFISLIYIYIFIASHQQKQLLIINIGITLFNIIGNIILIPYYSFIWAAIITLFSQIILVSLTFYYSRKIMTFSFPFKFTCVILMINIALYCIGSQAMAYWPLWSIWNIAIYGIWLFLIYSIGIFFGVFKKQLW